MKRLALVLAIAACGGGAKKPVDPTTNVAATPECDAVGIHVAEAVFTWKEPPPTKKTSVANVVLEHCMKDQWSVAARKCFGAITNEESAKPCVETLTKDQHEKVMNAMEATFDHKPQAPEAPPAAGAPAKGADPCEGGE